MPLHTTRDPIKRIEHICDREQRLHLRVEYVACYEDGHLGYTPMYYHDWPEVWLGTFHWCLLEFQGATPDSHVCETTY